MSTESSISKYRSLKCTDKLYYSSDCLKYWHICSSRITRRVTMFVSTKQEILHSFFLVDGPMKWEKSTSRAKMTVMLWSSDPYCCSCPTWNLLSIMPKFCMAPVSTMIFQQTPRAWWSSWSRILFPICFKVSSVSCKPWRFIFSLNYSNKVWISFPSNYISDWLLTFSTIPRSSRFRFLLRFRISDFFLVLRLTAKSSLFARICWLDCFIVLIKCAIFKLIIRLKNGWGVIIIKIQIYLTAK